MTDQPDPTSRRTAKSEARARAVRVLAEQQRAKKRKAALWQVGIGVAVLAIVGGAVAVIVTRDEPATTPPQVDADGAFVLGADDAPVTLTVVEDFQCPVCQSFEAQSGDLLAEYAAGDEVKVAYRGIAFLDSQSSGTEYSTRALNASACVMGEGEEVWKTFHDQLFLQQPPEGGTGLPDSRLVEIALDAGADRGDVEECISDGQYEGWTAKATDAVFDDGATGTPTIFVDGEQLDGFDEATIRTAVEEALAS